MSCRLRSLTPTCQPTLPLLNPYATFAGLLEALPVKVYGESMPLRDLALISTRDAQTLVVSLYDPSVCPAYPRALAVPNAGLGLKERRLGVAWAQTSQEVERAILESPLGLNPKGGSDTIIVPVPPMSAEARVEVAKIVSSSAEHAKVAVRARRKEVRHCIASSTHGASHEALELAEGGSLLRGIAGNGRAEAGEEEGTFGGRVRTGREGGAEAARRVHG